jgi:hypothetical protein
MCLKAGCTDSGSSQVISVSSASVWILPKAKAVPRHAMLVLEGRGSIALLILDLDTRWGWEVSVTSRPYFRPGKRTLGTHCTGGWVGPRAGLDTKTRGKILSPMQRIDPQSSGRPAHSQTHTLILPTYFKLGSFFHMPFNSIQFNSIHSSSDIR